MTNQKPTMCVMQVLPTLVSGGVETGTIDIAKSLLDQGHRAIVVSGGGPMVEQLIDLGAEHIPLPVQSKNPWQIWKNAQTLKRLILSKQVDIVHARSRAPAWSCYWATKSTNTAYMTTFHGAHSHQNKLKRWYNSSMLRGNTTIAVSDFIAEHIQQVYPGIQDDVQVIHRGIDTRKFNPLTINSEKVRQLKETWGLAGNNIVIMLPGRLTRLKGHSMLIKAAAEINQKDITYLIVGDEPGKDHYRAELEQLIKSKKLTAQFKFVGSCSDMPSAYHLADIVISASTKPEAFGRVACEAQAMNCLVVATNHGGSRETISEKQRAFLCRPNDSDSLKNAMEKALATPPEQAKIIMTESRSFIKERFTLDKMCADTLALYALQLRSQLKQPPSKIDNMGSSNARN